MRQDIAEQLAERPWYTSGSTLVVRAELPQKYLHNTETPWQLCL